MPSLIPGFEYDIFISYRQKDNKHDGWVSEFVENLKGELESTFKEEVSVYFDINPEDGLLETHDVDASLKEKLRCLVFIPIISRTYCDPKSFAWNFEFKAFVDQASKDQFGLKVKLPGGNIASRVLPVQIHDLDPDDKKLIEGELGSFIRGIEFIYKEPGVNKPLEPSDDEKMNLNKTKYRIQVNKVANAIKDIIDGIRNPGQLQKEIKENNEIEKPPSLLKRKTKIIAGSLIIFILFAAGYLLVTHYFRSSKPERSIAVLPFHNYSTEQDQEVMSEGLTDEIINNLFKIKSFSRVATLHNVLIFKGSNKKTAEIARELHVNYIIEGTYKKISELVKVSVTLTEPRNDKLLWQHEYNEPYEERISIQADIALQVANQLEAFISDPEKKSIEKKPTENQEAYNLYRQGRYLYDRRTKEGLLNSIEYFKKSIDKDPGFADAYAGLADTYCILVYWDWLPRNEGYSRAKEYANKAKEIDPGLAEAHAILGSVLLWGEWKWKEAEKELRFGISLNPRCAVARQYYSEYLDITRNFTEARSQINTALELDPTVPAFNATSALYYCNEGKFDKSLEASLETIKINPDFTKVYPLCIYSYIKLGQDRRALEVFQQMLRRDSLTFRYAEELNGIFDTYGINGIINWMINAEQAKPQPAILTIAWAYELLGEKEEALGQIEKAFQNPPADLPRINSYFVFNDLRSDPRFREIIRKMGLSEFQVLK